MNIWKSSGNRVSLHKVFDPDYISAYQVSTTYLIMPHSKHHEQKIQYKKIHQGCTE